MSFEYSELGMSGGFGTFPGRKVQRKRFFSNMMTSDLKEKTLGRKNLHSFLLNSKKI